MEQAEARGDGYLIEAGEPSRESGKFSRAPEIGELPSRGVVAAIRMLCC